jgi:Flp pilus assembly pilin Flp
MNIFRNTKGLAAVEYALIAALIAIAIVAGVKALGGAIRNKLDAAAVQIENS